MPMTAKKKKKLSKAGRWILDLILIAALLTGSFVIERLFAIPGIGKYFVQSVGDRDYNVILGITVFFGIFVVVCNIIVDILYVVIDPRVKFE